MNKFKPEIIWMDPEKLTPYGNNTKKHPIEQIDKIAGQIAAVGFTQPILVDKNNIIIAGHGRREAARRLGLKEVPVVVANHLSEDQIKAYRIADNKVAESVWDEDLLRFEFGSLDRVGFDLRMTGFDQDEIDRILVRDESSAGGGTGDPDDVPAAPLIVKSKLGDLYELGNHRVMCGDSTDALSVDRLVQGQKIEMLFTDPPYGVNYEGGHFHSGDVNIVRKREKLAADDSADIYKKVNPSIQRFVDGPCYSWFASTKAKCVIEAIEAIGELSAMLVWHKTNATYGAMNAQYKQRHEPCFYWKPKGSTLRWCGASTESTLWEVKRDGRNEFHPTQKPVELSDRAIKNHESKTILDLFAGSGSTLIACEINKRSGFMMELDPHYVDVIVTRWVRFTGNNKIKLNGEAIEWST